MSKKSEDIPRLFLIAEDDPSILRLIKKVFEEEGYSPVMARDGREAVKLLFSGDLFAGAIFDVNMPHINGIELAQMMQMDGRLKSIPVIIMTAEQNLLLLQQSYDSGAVAFLPKPFTLVQLRSILGTFVRLEH